eukprot:7642575-Alexandrium_andersonii.AAC.1
MGVRVMELSRWQLRQWYQRATRDRVLRERELLKLHQVPTWQAARGPQSARAPRPRGPSWHALPPRQTPQRGALLRLPMRRA